MWELYWECGDIFQIGEEVSVIEFKKNKRRGSMKKKLVLLLGIVAAVLAIIIGLSAYNAGKDRTTVNRGQSAETSAESETGGDGLSAEREVDENGVRIISQEADFVQTQILGNGVELALKEDIQENFILRVPATYQNQSVVSFEEITGNPYVIEIDLADGVYCEEISDCENLQKLHYGKIGAETLSENEDGSINLGNHPMYGTLMNCPALTEVTFSENDGYAQISIWLQLPALQKVELPNGILQMNLGFGDNSGITEMELPEQLRALSISFTNAPALGYVRCNDKLETISISFNNCPNLRYVVIPSKETEIDQSFEDCPNLTLVVEKDSAAEAYAKEQGIDYIYVEDFDPEVLETIEYETTEAVQEAAP
jgi:hypothetical protein